MLFFFQAEDGIRDLVRSRGLGDVYKRQSQDTVRWDAILKPPLPRPARSVTWTWERFRECGGGTHLVSGCLLYTSDAADERSSVDLGGRRIIKKKKQNT